MGVIVLYGRIHICDFVNYCVNLKAVVVRKCFIKHMCFIVLYFHSHAFFSLDIAQKCFFVLFFLKNVLYFVSYLNGWNFYLKFLFKTLK